MKRTVGKVRGEQILQFVIFAKDHGNSWILQLSARDAKSAVKSWIELNDVKQWSKRPRPSELLVSLEALGVTALNNVDGVYVCGLPYRSGTIELHLIARRKISKKNRG